MYAASSGESAMFFGVSGSIAGGQMYDGGSPPTLGTYSGMWKMAASYWEIHGTRNERTSGFGCERSMWQRQIQCAALDGKCSTTPAGCGSWTITKSYSSSSCSAFIAL